MPIISGQAMYCNVMLGALSCCNHCGSGKEISIAHSECVSLAIGKRHATRMRHVIL